MTEVIRVRDDGTVEELAMTEDPRAVAVEAIAEFWDVHGFDGQHWAGLFEGYMLAHPAAKAKVAAWLLGPQLKTYSDSPGAWPADPSPSSQEPPDQLDELLAGYFDARRSAIINVVAHKASPPEYPGLALVPVSDIERLEQFVELPRTREGYAVPQEHVGRTTWRDAARRLHETGDDEPYATDALAATETPDTTGLREALARLPRRSIRWNDHDEDRQDVIQRDWALALVHEPVGEPALASGASSETAGLHRFEPYPARGTFAESQTIFCPACGATRFAKERNEPLGPCLTPVAGSASEEDET